MADGSVKQIQDVSEGDVLQGDIGIVIVTKKMSIHGSRKIIGFNGIAPFVTANHPILTEYGWGAVDVSLLQNSEPGTYQSVLDENADRPVITLAIGTNIAIWKESVVAHTPIEYITEEFVNDATVYWLQVTGNQRYIANGFIVHNKAGAG